MEEALSQAFRVRTHAEPGDDRRGQPCECSRCIVTAICEPRFDFYGRDGAPLVCELCFREKLESEGFNTKQFMPPIAKPQLVETGALFEIDANGRWKRTNA